MKYAERESVSTVLRCLPSHANTADRALRLYTYVKVCGFNLGVCFYQTALQTAVTYSVVVTGLLSIPSMCLCMYYHDTTDDESVVRFSPFTK